MGVGKMLKRSVKQDVPQKITANWRIREDNFANKNTKRILEPGAVTFSAGWFGLGHEVSFKFYLMNSS
jgi:hypothetical protein